MKPKYLTRPPLPRGELDLRPELRVLEQLIKPFVYPLFVTTPKSKVELIGSGFFIEISGLKLFVSAAHCLSQKQGFSTITTRGRVSLFGKAIKTRGTDDDQLDIGAINIGSPFIEQNMINLIPSNCHADLYEFENPHLRAIVGFPASKNKAAFIKHEIRCDMYASIATSKVNFETFGMSEKHHSCMTIQRRGISHTGVEENTISPRGLSGGPSWTVPNLDKPQEVYLDGLVIELRQNAYVFSVKIEVMKEFLRNELPSIS